MPAETQRVLMVMERVKTMTINRECLTEVEAALERYEEEVEGTRRTTLPGSSTPTNWLGSGARSTRMKRAGPRPSPRSGCWRSPDAVAAKCSICDGATSTKARWTWPARRAAHAQ